MPTYEFRTPDGTIVERMFKISEVPESIELPDGQVAVRIISGGAGLLFKGSGFYITDYGKDGKKDQRAGASGGESSSSASESKSSESKADSKSTTASTAKSDAKPAAAPAPKAD